MRRVPPDYLGILRRMPVILANLEGKVEKGNIGGIVAAAIRFFVSVKIAAKSKAIQMNTDRHR